MNRANRALFTWMIGAALFYALDVIPIETGEAVLSTAYGILFWFSLLLPRESSRSRLFESFLIYMSSIVLGMMLGLCFNLRSRLGIYGFFMAYFHFSEFYWVSRVSGFPSFDSFLINHGKEYATAFTISMIEFHYSPISFFSPPLFIGVFLSSVGLVVRACAMITAGSGFTHLIAKQKSHSHRLITHGIYSCIRHPGYSGWLIWVIGSQLILGNFISLVLFTGITWKFFSERIPYEEHLLVDFFGSAYTEYKDGTPISGVPFIS
jgi:protein-S-isoprenylcysteine O-methyltransferase